MAKKHTKVASLYSLTTRIVNVVGASAKCCDILQEKYEAKIVEALKSGEISTGQGLNQTSLKHPSDTRWGSHYGTLLNLISIFSSIVDVLDVIVNEGIHSEQRSKANNVLESMLSFDFAFSLHLMKNLLRVTNELSKELQRKDQYIINAMNFVKLCKQ